MEKKVRITVHTGEGTACLSAAFGDNLLSVLQQNGVPVSAPCGGKGTCGKCGVNIQGVGAVLACNYTVSGDIDVTVSIPKEAQIAVAGRGEDFSVNPACCKTVVSLTPPTLENPIDAFAALQEVLRGSYIIGRDPLTVLAKAYEEGNTVTVVHDGTTIYCLSEGNTTDRQYGIAIDIGTTTVVCYAVDLLTGRILDTESGMNAQRSFGADVIARIAYAKAHGTQPLRQCIVEQLQSMIGCLVNRNFKMMDSILLGAVVGNATMLHFLLGIPCNGIAKAPFAAAFLNRLCMPAREVGLLESAVPIHVLPSASSYVGADITAAVYTARMEENSLLLDIGTNGEMALRIGDGYLCCATAAGPAFEGANLSCGMAGETGAIYSVNESLDVKVIGGGEAKGICGTGAIDALNVLLKKGMVDETGYLEEDICLAKEVFLTPKDVRELQLAKAAIRAGLECLLQEAGIAYDQVTQVYLAGGFGSKISPHSAAAIGMIPHELENKTIAIGNGAGMGAVAAVLDKGAIASMDGIAKNMRYLELSSHKEFQELYVEHMLFE